MRISDWSSDVCSSDLGHHRVLVGDVAAELVAEVLAHLRQRIGHAVAVVLGGNGGQRVRLVAVLLEILLGDEAEDAGEAAFDLAVLLQVGRLQERRSEERRLGKECGSTCRYWWSP